MQRRTVLLVPSDDCGWTELRNALEAMSDVQVVGEARNPSYARHLAARFRPDVVIAAARLDDESALPLLADLRGEIVPASKLFVIAAQLDPDEIVGLAAVGVSAQLLWNDLPAQRLRHLLAAVIPGDLVVASREIAAAFVASRDAAIDQAAALTKAERPESTCKLSDREWMILPLLVEEQTYEEIAAGLHISPGTVKTHARHIGEKLGARGRHRIVAEARRRGCLSSP